MSTKLKPAKEKSLSNVEETLPWRRLLTVTRDDAPELSFDGFIAITDGSLKASSRDDKINIPTQLKHWQDFCPTDGYTRLWTRSLMKPFQLLVLMPRLVRTHLKLEPADFALMMGSHNGEPQHIQALFSLLKRHELTPDHLLCPECYPMDAATSRQLKIVNEKASRLYHPCSAKHCAYRLASQTLEALPEELRENYCDPEHPLHQETQRLLQLMLELFVDFPTTVDGCGLPSFGLHPLQLAKLYQTWAQPLSDDLSSRFDRHFQPTLSPFWHVLREVMMREAWLIGGTDRLDTRLLQGKVWAELPPVYAKEGADGLLAVGLPAETDYPDGLGIVIKLASGYQPDVLETVLHFTLYSLGILSHPPKPSAPSLQYHWPMLRL